MKNTFSTTLFPKALGIATLLCLSISSSAQVPAHTWSKGMGSTGADLGLRMATDGSGNTYTTGSFTGSLATGVGTLTSAGGTDVFVIKLDVSGNFLWAIHLGGTDDDVAQSIAVDGSGNVYLTGSFKSTADFDPGPSSHVLTSNGGNDVFVCKLNAGGGLEWAVSTGTTADDVGNAIAIDADGEVITCGNIGNLGTADFDPDAGTVPVTSLGGTDDFIWKLDNDGHFVFVKQIGSTVSDLCNSLALDAGGHIYLTGSFNASTDFDPDGTGSFILNPAGSNDIFVCKLDNDGNFVWAAGFGSFNTDIGYYITVDNAGNLLVTGSFAGTVDFDPDITGSTSLTAAGLSDPFVLKLNPAGDFIWAKHFTGSGFDRGLGLAVDGANNVYACGLVSATTDFDPGAGTFNITGAGSNDGYVCRLDANGNFSWAFTLASSGDDAVQSVKLAPGKIYAVGRFSGMVDFDPGAGTSNLTSAGGTDIFIAAYQPSCSPTSSSITTSSCNSYTLNDSVYTSNGTYIQVLTNAAGCDSTITLNLTINHADAGNITNGGNYLSTDAVGTYQWVDCNAAYAPIGGETSSTYTATADGDYAVIVTQTGCADTSACHNITITGIDPLSDPSSFSVYPNPVANNMSFGSAQAGNMLLTNLQGQPVMLERVKKGNNTIDINHLPTGIYLLTLPDQASKARIVKL